MTPTPEPSAASSAGVIDFVAYLPLVVGIIGLAGLLVAAAWAARSAIIVRLMDSQRDVAQVFTAFQQDAVSSMNELAISMSRYIEQPNDLAALAEEVATRQPPGAQSVTIDLSNTARERVRAATDLWRLTLARAHAFGGQSLNDALSAVDRQREVVVNLMNAEDWDAARAANDQLRSHENRQAYRRLQIIAMEHQIATAQLLRRRSLRLYLRKWEKHMMGERTRGEQMITDAQRKHTESGAVHPVASGTR